MSVFGYLKDIFVRPTVYRKFWVSFASFVLTVLSIGSQTSPYLQALATALGPIGVIILPNNKPYRLSK